MGMIVDRLNSQRGAIASSDERATAVMRFRLIKATRRLTIQLMRKKRHEMPRQASLVKRGAENRHARWERSCCNRGAARSAKQLLTLSLSLSFSLQPGVSDITCIYGGGQTMGRRTEMNRVPFDVS